MAWAFSDGIDVAEVTKDVSFGPGEGTFGRFLITMTANVNSFYEPDPEKKWQIRPLFADVRLVKNHDVNRRQMWGTFQTHGSYVVPSGTDARRPNTHQVLFARAFDPVEIAAMEEWRDGSDLDVHVIVHGFGHKGNEIAHRYFNEAQARIFSSQWEGLLKDIKFHEYVNVRIPVTSGRVAAAAVRLREAQEKLDAGDHVNVVHTCRKALEALGQAGFGRRTPKDINGWIRTKRDEEEQYTLEDRTAVLQAAARVLCNLGSHEAKEAARIQRFDAELMLAVTAGIIRAAPYRLASAEAIPDDEP
ncbi:MAG TPA: hypothetical protein VHJ20_01160 [Polyangia bacterium]|nr:hypothetical protein [Polyangia bacterium]